MGGTGARQRGAMALTPYRSGSTEHSFPCVPSASLARAWTACPGTNERARGPVKTSNGKTGTLAMEMEMWARGIHRQG